MARIMRSDDRENTAGLSRTASMTSGPSGQVSPSATITLGLVDPTIPLLKLSTGRAALIGKERNSIPVFGSSSSALVATDRASGANPAVTSRGLPCAMSRQAGIGRPLPQPVERPWVDPPSILFFLLRVALRFGTSRFRRQKSLAQFSH